LILLLAAEQTVTYLTDRRTEYTTNRYLIARAAGMLPLLWLMIGVIVVSPIAEELIFRGFLYRGWVSSPRAVVPDGSVGASLSTLAMTQSLHRISISTSTNDLLAHWTASASSSAPMSRYPKG
jgi:membrane protease YdiL (CAAX protease family)